MECESSTAQWEMSILGQMSSRIYRFSLCSKVTEQLDSCSPSCLSGFLQYQGKKVIYLCLLESVAMNKVLIFNSHVYIFKWDNLVTRRPQIQGKVGRDPGISKWFVERCHCKYGLCHVTCDAHHRKLFPCVHRETKKK